MQLRIRPWAIALALLCIGLLWLQFRHIDETFPYPWHIDEGFVSGPAARTVATGTFHPYTFNYPSLPKYLAAAGMAQGYLRAASDPRIHEVREIGNTGFPYYDHPFAMQSARRLFATLATITVAMTGVAAWLALGTPAVLLLAPIALALSPLFFYHSWVYLNVDIIAACFTTLTIAAVLHGLRERSVHWSAIIPATLAGLAIGSKYTMAAVLPSVLLGTVLALPAGHRMWPLLGVVGACIGAFILAVPYSLIDIPGFLNGLASEATHYAGGHRGASADPGFAQLLFYLRQFATEFGPIGAAAAVIGIFAVALRDWRSACVLLLFAVMLLWLLASQRTHFERNVLSLLPIAAIFTAAGVLFLRQQILKVVRARWPDNRRSGFGWTNAAISVVVIGLAIPLWHLRDHLRDRTDSRTLAREWIEEKVPRDWAVVIPVQLGFDARPLEAAGRAVRSVDVQSAADLRAAASAPGAAVVLVPHWGADPRFPGQENVAALNDAASGWRFLRTFGSHDVLINYSSPTPDGDPRFGAVAVGQGHNVAP